MNTSTSYTISANSRYKNTPLYITEDGHPFWGIWNPITFPPSVNDTYTTLQKPFDCMRFDCFAFNLLNNFELWWVLCEANNIANPFKEVNGSNSPAVSNIVYSTSEKPMMRFISKIDGPENNSGNSSGLTMIVYEDSLKVCLNYNVVETFKNLSVYRTVLNSQTGTYITNPNFWGNVKSKYIQVEWVYDKEPDSTLKAPGNINGKTYYMFGGSRFSRKTLRVPGTMSIHNQLS